MDPHAQSARQQEELADLADTQTRKALEERQSPQDNLSAPARYVQRVPQEITLLVRQVFPVVLLLAMFGIVRMRGHVFVAALPFFFLYPLVTARSFDRFVFPYVPILALYTIIGVHHVKNPRLRQLSYTLLIVGGLALPVSGGHSRGAARGSPTTRRRSALNWKSRGGASSPPEPMPARG